MKKEIAHTLSGRYSASFVGSHRFLITITWVESGVTFTSPLDRDAIRIFPLVLYGFKMDHISTAGIASASPVGSLVVFSRMYLMSSSKTTQSPHDEPISPIAWYRKMSAVMSSYISFNIFHKFCQIKSKIVLSWPCNDLFCRKSDEYKILQFKNWVIIFIFNILILHWNEVSFYWTQLDANTPSPKSFLKKWSGDDIVYLPAAHLLQYRNEQAGCT